MKKNLSITWSSIINYESGLKNSYKLYVGNFQCKANKEMLTDADPDAPKFFNTGYADADLCMRIMSLWCKKETEF